VRGPSCVSDTSVRIEDLLVVWSSFLNELLQRSNLADLLESKDFVLLVSIDTKARRIVAAVF
jgi:hypothetical protein